MFRVKAHAEQRGRHGREDQKFQDRDARNLGPQTDHQRSRTTDNQKAANNLAPANVALLHERSEHFGKRFARRSRGFSWYLSAKRRMRSCGFCEGRRREEGWWKVLF